MKYAKFEERSGTRELARKVYERAIEELGEDGNDEQLFLAFAHFEERCREVN